MLKSLISKSLEAMINEAIQSELYASNLYKHVANQLQRLGYFGGQKHFLHESEDELKHYQLHVDFLNDSGTVAKVPAIEAVNDKVLTLHEALSIAYETELALERDYTRYYKASMDEDPVMAQHLLQFLHIQRKSVGEYGDWLARMDRAGMNEAAILLVDQELGA